MFHILQKNDTLTKFHISRTSLKPMLSGDSIAPISHVQTPAILLLLIVVSKMYEVVGGFICHDFCTKFRENRSDYSNVESGDTQVAS
jgi:hypothetical protein